MSRAYFKPHRPSATDEASAANERRGNSPRSAASLFGCERRSSCVWHIARMVLSQRGMAMACLFIMSLNIGCQRDSKPQVAGNPSSGDTTPARTSDDRNPTLKSDLVAVPLRPAGKLGDATKLFEPMDVATTGIDFTNYLKPENNVPYIYMGAGVAAGDYDNDGRVDLYLASVDGPNRLYRQSSHYRFEDVTAAAGNVDGGSAWSRGTAFFDADNDGDLDLYVCNTRIAELLLPKSRRWDVPRVRSRAGVGLCRRERDGGYCGL